MPTLSKSSLAQLATCDPRLQRVLRYAIQWIDFTVLEGHRDKASQNKAFDEGKSQVRWPNGKHNSLPSRAVDIAPYPIDWNDRERFVLFAGVILGISGMLGIRLRWGGDWNQDWKVKDEKFRDLGHFELIDP